MRSHDSHQTRAWLPSLQVILGWVAVLGLGSWSSYASASLRTLECNDEIQPNARVGVDEEFKSQLAELAETLRGQSLEAEADLVGGWYIPRDPQRLYVFLPQARDPDAPSQDENDWSDWYQSFREIRANQADELFKLARAAVESGDGGQAAMLLHETLHENPDHEEARRILGYTLRDTGWSLGASDNSSSVIRRRHGAFDWAPGQHWKVATDHFVISTSHSEEEGERLGRVLERLNSVWQQVFYDYWGDAETLARRFDSDRVSPRSSVGRGGRKFKIILFEDRDEYIRELGRDVPGIDATYGYYSPDRRESFFFAEGKAHERTWYHETCHQLFQESIRAIADVGSGSNAWALEGIATFMESWQDHGRFVTLGGFDASWLQFARFRKQNQRVYIPMQDLVQLGKSQLQASESIQIIYSQSAGLSHFLMTGQNQSYRRSYIAFLEFLYRSPRNRPDAIFELSDASAEKLDSEYEEFLTVTREDLNSHLLVPSDIRQLVLGFSKIDDSDLQSLRETTELELLDLTATGVGDEAVSYFADNRKINQLYAGGTRITDQGLELIGQLSELQELDLVGAPVSSKGVQQLAGLTKLVSLRLTSTQVDDDVVDTLIRMQSLQSVDLSDTKVSPSAISRLRTARSDLQIQN